METFNEQHIPPIPGNDSRIPPIPHDTTTDKPSQRKKWIIVAAAVACVAIAVILLLKFNGKTSPNADTKEQESDRRIETGTTEPEVHRNVTVRTYTGAEADSMMRAEMARMDSMMNEMMNDPFFSGGLGDMLDPFQDPTQPVSSPQKSREPRRAATNGVVNLAGNIGNRSITMKLNLRDPQNVSGIGSWADGHPLKMLGIGNGNELDVSIYDGNSLLGTLSGVWNGSRFRGVYLENGKETSFSLLAQ